MIIEDKPHSFQEKSKEELDTELYLSNLSMCRKRRDKLLTQTDWIFLPDVTVDESYKAAMLDYRQKLRDFTVEFKKWYDAMDEEDHYHISELNIPFPEEPK